MHKFLRAAGFPDIRDAEVLRLIWQKAVRPENVTARLSLDEEAVLLEYRLPVNEYIGICAAVLYAGEEFKELKYYYPYYVTGEISSDCICTIEGHTNGDTCSGVLDEYSLGILLMFFMTDPVIYRQRPDAGEKREFKGAFLTAFANEATVLLPVQKPQEIIADGIVGDGTEKLIEAAMEGDADAIETLTASDMDMYYQINDRIETEDLYSVVEQSFMPCGVECDQYAVIGEILRVEENVNILTEEALWLMKLTCNDVEFWLCIRKADLIGEPMKGRRIKCRLWMQGRVDI